MILFLLQNYFIRLRKRSIKYYFSLSFTSYYIVILEIIKSKLCVPLLSAITEKLEYNKIVFQFKFYYLNSSIRSTNISQKLQIVFVII